MYVYTHWKCAPKVPFPYSPFFLCVQSTITGPGPRCFFTAGPSTPLPPAQPPLPAAFGLHGPNQHRLRHGEEDDVHAERDGDPLGGHRHVPAEQCSPFPPAVVGRVDKKVRELTLVNFNA